MSKSPQWGGGTPGVIDVFTFALDVPSWADCESALAPDEIDRAGRFRFVRDRRRYVVGRAQLRAILGAYVGRDPRELRFSYGGHGKPALPAERAEPRLDFNLTRSHELGMLAIQLDADIGLDVELLRPFPEALDIAKRFFAPQEFTMLASLPAADVAAAFFSCWTRKEAMVKSMGLGLSQPIDGPIDRWVAPLLAPQYVAAVASTVPPDSIRPWSWPQ
jgi:4'-phosphopantetheinyl transferase